jgi:ornithine cyclodeaminase/alanine dehydrogenase-like protein (mu-crystallin family)
MVLVLSHADVERLLPMEDCIEVMTETLAALARGELFQPLRSVVRPPDASGFFGLMPAHRGGERAAVGRKGGTKVPGTPCPGLASDPGAGVR